MRLAVPAPGSSPESAGKAGIGGAGWCIIIGSVGLEGRQSVVEVLSMIEALKSDDIVNKVGGRFRLTALIQRRLAEIIDGARPLVDRNGMSDLEVVIEEIMQDKITIDDGTAAD
jgi:DNA-directed RNA polymerase subunit omega